jgi:hypothetical protein
MGAVVSNYNPPAGLLNRTDKLGYNMFDRASLEAANIPGTFNNERGEAYG